MASNSKSPKRYDHSIYRLVISNLINYGTFQVTPTGSKRSVGTSLALDKLKQIVLDYLLQQQFKRTVKPIHWSIAWETHAASGLPHLDVLLVFQRNVKPTYTSFDYLIRDLKLQQKQQSQGFKPGHVWVTAYSSRRLSRAVLDYGQKQDPRPITNLNLAVKQQLIAVNLVKVDPYRYLQLQMLKDPLHFNLEQYVRRNDLAQYISNWSSIKTKIRDMQVAAANLQLREKPGFQLITPTLIQQKLSDVQYRRFKSWEGYQIIVDYLNQIVTHGTRRKMKTKNLLIIGLANIGKTSLFHNPNHQSHQNPVEDYVSVYPMGMSTWFPQYKSHVYKLILWNQAKLTSYSFDTILKILEGSYVDLPVKGGVAQKRDNPLIIMTSNMTLDQMIQQKFSYNESYIQMARANLAVRVTNVVVPNTYDLFLLQKLLVKHD